jgi:hypothetical protein
VFPDHPLQRLAAAPQGAGRCPAELGFPQGSPRLP